LQWVFWNIIFKIISEICDEPHSIRELNKHSLSIYRRPFTCKDFLCSTVDLRGALWVKAKHSFRAVIILQIDSPNLLFRKWKGEIFPDKLESVWNFVSAHIFSLEYIDILLLFRYMEVPYSIHVFPQAVHWLISLNILWRIQ
jgi:hypothetical protein